MAQNITLIVYPVQDLVKAKKFYANFLDTEPYAETDFYVGYMVGNLEVGLDPHGKTVVSYIDVPDIASRLAELNEAGATVVMETKDVGGGILVAQVEKDGNILGLRQPVK